MTGLGRTGLDWTHLCVVDDRLCHDGRDLELLLGGHLERNCSSRGSLAFCCSYTAISRYLSWRQWYCFPLLAGSLCAGAVSTDELVGFICYLAICDDEHGQCCQPSRCWSYA